MLTYKLSSCKIKLSSFKVFFDIKAHGHCVIKKSHAAKSTLNLQRLNIFEYSPDNCSWPVHHLEQTAAEKNRHCGMPAGTLSDTHSTVPLAAKVHAKVNCHFCLSHNTSNCQS